MEIRVTRPPCWYCGKRVEESEAVSLTDIMITFPADGMARNLWTKSVHFADTNHPFDGSQHYWCATFHRGCLGHWIAETKGEL